MMQREQEPTTPSEGASRDSRSRILDAALEMFTGRGYRATSMREVAEQVGLTKATLYHHFRSKSDIIHGLLTPLLDQLDQDLGRVTADDLDAAREQVLVYCVETMLAHRHVLNLLLRDTSVYYDEEEIAARFVAWMDQATLLLAGSDAGWSGRIRAAQAIAAIADPLTLALPAPETVLRRELLRGARRILDLEVPG